MSKKEKEKEKESKELMQTEPARPLSPLDIMERRFEDLFRRPFSLLSPSWWPGTRMPEMEEITPTVDIFEEGDDIVMKAELPGISKEDIEVSFTDNTVTISGEKKKEEKIEKKNYYRVERSYGSFSRSFHIPSEVQTDQAKAQFKDGILEIRVPKTEEAKKKPKKIPIE
ncbi:MAG: Hsp20/alpha crystallin family protein [Alphaproteobacteria bacterium]|uniref:Hsp20/alpha crystallin family protein n=1 Tax=Candidatus Nitrobium versatile TaxID=2884831 RepID=A0A953M307_9BACT|nr:Hsp20/alpha crystallin family protein [Candidatus Nitrobium versatile]